VHEYVDVGRQVTLDIEIHPDRGGLGGRVEADARRTNG
jgi:hypothetical protein